MTSILERAPRKLLSATAMGAAAIGLGLHFTPALANHWWNQFHWSHVSALQLRLGDNVTAAWDPYLQAASRAWTRSAPLDTVVIRGASDRATCSPVYGRIEVCNARYGATDWVGIGNVWSSGGHVVQGTVQLNDTYFAEARYNTPAWRRLVMCQEIGHVLGLDHQDVNHTNTNLGTCMDYTRDPAGTAGTNGNLSNQLPNQHDYAQLNSIYTHQDSSQLRTTRLASAAAASPAEETEKPPPGERGRRLGQAIDKSPKAWGRVAATDAKGKPRVYVKDLGSGDQVATFVIWADERPEEHDPTDHTHETPEGL